MKKIILAIGILFLTLSGMADNYGRNDSIRYLASTLSQNWFFSASGSINWWQGSDRLAAENFTTVNGPSFGGGVSVGKWITHNIAFRLAYDVNPGLSYIQGRHINLTSINFLYGDNPTPISVTAEDGSVVDYYSTSFMYHNLHGDLMLSPVDLFLGYYDKRFYTPVVVMGLGIAGVSEHLFISESYAKHEATNLELSFNGGIMHLFNVLKHFDLFVNTSVAGQRWTIDSWTYESGAAASASGKRPKMFDLNYNISLGVIWSPSATEEQGSRIYDESDGLYDIERQELENHIKDLSNSLDSLQANPSVIYETVTVTTPGETQFVSAPFSIFFNLDSDQLMSERDLINLREIAQIAMTYGLNMHLRGTCDSATGSVAYNKRLAERRCKTIKKELLKMNVPESQIDIEPIGGVADLDPTEFDRRVLITLTK